MVNPMKIILDDPYYYPGSVVKGSVLVLVSADKPRQFVNISIEILGFARAKWTEAEDPGSRTYLEIKNTLRYIEQKCVLWSRERSPTGNLPAGEHSFPFSVQLPYQAPPSFKSFTGKIVYQMEARFSPYHGYAKATLDVRSHIPRLCMRPKDEELDSRLTFCCCFNFGQVTVNCSLPRSGYVVAEAIPISMEIDNQSNKSIYIRASLSKIITYNSGRDRTKTSSSNNLAVSKSQRIPPGTTSLLEKLLNIPRKLPVSITNCPVMSVNYFLVIQARSIIGSSEQMKIPIVIAHAPTPPSDDYMVYQILGILCGQLQ